MVRIGAWLRRLREGQGLTQAQAAALIKVNPKTVERWEAGRHEPQASELGAYVQALGGEAAEFARKLMGLDDPIERSAIDTEIDERIARLSPRQKALLADLLRQLLGEAE